MMGKCTLKQNLILALGHEWIWSVVQENYEGVTLVLSFKKSFQNQLNQTKTKTTKYIVFDSRFPTQQFIGLSPFEQFIPALSHFQCEINAATFKVAFQSEIPLGYVDNENFPNSGQHCYPVIFSRGSNIYGVWINYRQRIEENLEDSLEH